MNVYVWTNSLKNAYIGWVIECDFTQSYCWFTYAQNSGSCTYGRDSNWLYCKANSWYSHQATAWKVPSNIYSKNLKKATFEFSGTWTNNGWWFAIWVDSKVIRYFTALRVIWWTQNSAWTTQSSPANTKWTFTVDLENKLLSSSIYSTTLTLTDNAISAFNTDWAAGNVNITCISWDSSGTTWYLSKLTLIY